MEVTGKIIFVLPEVSGTSKAGKPWKKREYVLETTDGSFPQKIHFNFFGDRADQFPLKEGQIIKLSFDINSREFNGRWYTDISGWRAEEVTAGAASMPAAAGVQPSAGAPYTPPVAPIDLDQNGPTDDLPF